MLSVDEVSRPRERLGLVGALNKYSRNGKK